MKKYSNNVLQWIVIHFFSNTLQFFIPFSLSYFFLSLTFCCFYFLSFFLKKRIVSNIQNWKDYESWKKKHVMKWKWLKSREERGTNIVRNYARVSPSSILPHFDTFSFSFNSIEKERKKERVREKEQSGKGNLTLHFLSHDLISLYFFSSSLSFISIVIPGNNSFFLLIFFPSFLPFFLSSIFKVKTFTFNSQHNVWTD